MVTLNSSQLTTIRDNFAKELLDASLGKQTSLPFIKHQLSEKPLVSTGETFQILVIGGSVFRTALAVKERRRITILDQFEEELPQLSTKEIFLAYLEKHLHPGVQVISCNFAYPLTPLFTNNILDGQLLWGTKEHQFTGLVGQPVGKTIREHFFKQYGRTVTVSVANDVICLLLAGLQAAPKEQLAAVVMGTGTNMTFFHEGYAVNLESANFNKFTPSPECKEIDAASQQPGKALFEKEVAGAYLYQQMNLLMGKQNPSFPAISSTKQLKDFAEDKKQPEAIRSLAQSLIEKSATYLAAQLAGLATFKQSDTTVVMEGSLYWKSALYRKTTSQALEALSPKHAVHLVKVDNSPILGAAKLVA